MLVYPQIKNHFISMTGVTLAEHHNVLHVLSTGFEGLPESVGPHKSHVVSMVYFLAIQGQLKYHSN